MPRDELSRPLSISGRKFRSNWDTTFGKRGVEDKPEEDKTQFFYSCNLERYFGLDQLEKVRMKAVFKEIEDANRQAD